MGTVRPAYLESRLELADIGRLARRLLRRAVAAARTEDAPVQRALWEHLGPQAASVPVVRATWPGYDRVNVQVGLNAWLAELGRRYELAGITGFHPGPGIADLVRNEQWRGARMGSPATDLLPAGPGGVTLACWQCGLCLVTDGPRRLALLIQAAGPEVSVDAACADAGRARQVIEEIRQLSIERNVFRGHVISFGAEVFGPRRQELLSFLERPEVGREQVILQPDLLERIERQVVGVGRHESWLRASGQHLKRGVLLHGPPGTGKTHTVRYLLGQMPGVTVVVLTGAALSHIAAACSVARALQPSMVVVEDVDLIAEQRDSRGGQHPLLFQLLNEMDGLGEDADVTFLLTTNRADLLEPALAQRPGRVDHAAELPLPDADARRRLVRLYQHDLVLDLASPAEVIAQTEGVTASFLKELLRRAALYAAEDAADQDPGTAGERGDAARGPLTVRDAHMNAALAELLDSRNQLTRALLGGHAAKLVDVNVDYDAVMLETRKAFGDVSVWPSGDLVATVEIGRPPDNFFDAELITSLADACAWLDGQPEFRAAVLCSDGKHFCAGADFTGRSGRPGMGGAKELYAAAARLFEARTPVVAAVQGAAVGGGLGLACAADFRVASPRARFCANFARIGLHHGFALTVTLPAIVGEQRALDLLCTGRRMGGEEAARIGLADRLADPEGLRAAAQELAAEIAAGAPLAVRSIRATMRGALADRARAAMDRELAEQDRLRQTADFAEGIRASGQRRPPRFEGR